MAIPNHTLTWADRAVRREAAKAMVFAGTPMIEVARPLGMTVAWVSTACREGLPAARPAAECQRCGYALKTKRLGAGGRNRKYCSDSCRHSAGKRKIPCRGCGCPSQRGRCAKCAHAAGRKYVPRECAICKSSFTSSDLKKECCSLACGRVLGGQRQGWGTGIETIRCEGCLQEFQRKRNRCRDAGRFCTRECYWNWRRAQLVWRVPRARERVNLGSRRRDQRLRDAVREPVDLIKVLQRDKWTCQECGVKTPRSLRGSMDSCAPECDHVVSLAAGGSHTYANLRCLCRRCNRRKGARTRGQLGLPLSA